MADPTLYLYTSLTAGSSHIITATSRLETILKANKIPFQALDCATDEKARTLWSRRSRGRTLPGLVKFGQVIGDLEQVEEWNEFGELHEQIEDADDFLDDSPALSNPNAISLRPEPGPGVANKLTPIQPAPPGRKLDQTATSNASSRASSETRHISISEPGKSAQATSENPMAMTMRQLGAEAAAKAKEAQRKASGTVPKSVPTTTAPDLPAAQPASPTAAKERESSDPSQEPEVTAAKTPAQLAAEGAKRTSVDKIESKADATPSSPTSASATAEEVNEDVSEPVTSPVKSTEEQVLDLRRQSTQVDQPSKLHESLSAEPDDEDEDEDDEEVKDEDENEVKNEVKNEPSKTTTVGDATKTDVAEDIEPPVAEAVSATDDKPTSQTASTATDAKSEEDESKSKDDSTTIASTEPAADPKPDSVGSKDLSSTPDAASAPATSGDSVALPSPQSRSHRGSSVEIADKAEIQKIEEQNKIDEHPEEDENAIDDDVPETEQKVPVETAKGDDPTADLTKASAISDSRVQETAAKDPTAATKSVED